MALFVEVSGTPVKSGLVTIPWIGIWHADVVLDRTVALDGPLTLTLGNLVLQGTRYRSGSFSGSTSHRIVGGAGGWIKTLGSKFYYSPFGVKINTVLSDAANAVGETLVISGSLSSPGTYYTREEAPAGRTLNNIVPSWWMRPDGKTEIGTRASPMIVSQFDVLKEGTNLALGKLMVATDFPLDWMPGARFLAPQLGDIRTISAVVHQIDGSKFRTEVWMN